MSAGLSSLDASEWTSVARCGTLSFLGYYIPTCLMRRRLTNPRAALAVASFASTYRVLRATDHSAASCGCLAALAGSVVDRSFAESSLFISICVTRSLRGVEWTEERLRGHPLLLNVVATGLLAPPGFRAPHEHHRSYTRFLESFMVLDGVASPEKFRDPPAGVSVARHLVGRGGNIWKWFTRYTWLVFLKTLKMYVPLHLAFALIRARSRGFHWFSFLKSIAQSSAFLTSYVMAAIACLLLHTSLLSTETPRWQVQLWAWIPGLMVIFEDRRRQLDLGLFCLAHGLNALYNHFASGPPNWIFGTLALMASSSIIMRAQAKKPNKVMQIFFEEPAEVVL